MDDQERAELRELQAKAFSSEGTITAAERESLRELQKRAQQRAEPVEAEEEAPSIDSEVEELPVSHPRPPRWGLWTAIAACLALALGMGGTSLIHLSGQDDVLTPELYALRAELAERGEYDPGSLAVVGERDGVTVWQATRQEGRLSCALLTLADGSGGNAQDGSAACSRLRAAEESGETTSYPASMVIPSPADNDQRIVIATPTLTVTDEVEIVFNVNHRPSETSYEDQFYGPGSAEIVSAIRNMAGLDGGTSLDRIGEDGAVSIWTYGTGSSGLQTGTFCLALHDASADDPVISFNCVERADFIDENPRVALTRLDEDSRTEVSYVAEDRSRSVTVNTDDGMMASVSSGTQLSIERRPFSEQESGQ